MSNEEKAEYIQRLGNAASIGLFHPLCKIFKDPSIDGIIGYRLEHNCAVVIGDPVCEPKHSFDLAQSFKAACDTQKHSCIYVMASAPFTSWAVDTLGASAIQIGHEIIIDPTVDTRMLTGMYPHHLRQKYKHAVAHGVSAYEYTTNNFETEQTFNAIARQWLAARTWAQIYVLPLDIFAHRASKRWFYACKDGKIIGFLMLNKIASNGWVLNGSIMLTQDAPNSTSEFLMMHVLEVLRAEGHSYFSAGATVSTDVERIEGFGRLCRLLINGAMKSARKIFKMQDRQRYWKKFLPRREPSFVMFTSRFGLKEIRAILRTYNVNM